MPRKVLSAAEAVGDAARCREVADALDPFSSQCVMWGRSYVFGMPVAEAVGIARRGAGQPDEAAAAFSLARAWAARFHSSKVVRSCGLLCRILAANKLAYKRLNTCSEHS